MNYMERTDRNMGVITVQEQQKLRRMTVAIAGCGGMGGLIAERLVRVGVGRIKLADNQIFEPSNLNRQFASNLQTLGFNKAESVAAEIKKIAADFEVEVFAQGVTEQNVASFVSGADIVCDEIEFFEIPARIWLHRAARSAGVPVFNCNVVGFGTRIFLFTPESMTMEEFLDIDVNTPLDEDAIGRLVCRLAPDLPKDIKSEILEEWVFKMHKAPIFGVTPLISAGIVANRIILHYLGYFSRPWLKPIPEMPGFAAFDSGNFESKIFAGRWW